jgi:phosphomannomutase
MALIKSISGIRGTIGGKQGTALTPIDVVKFTAAYGAWVTSQQWQHFKALASMCWT